MASQTPSSNAASELLAVRNLHVAFGAVEVLHGVDLSVRTGRIHALIGESGSGKSVLARSILGLAGRTSRTTGSIRFAGRELVGLTEDEYRALRGAEIGLVVQDAMSALNPMRTIGEQLAETLAYRHPDYRNRMSGAAALVKHKADLTDQALGLLKTVGITAPEKRMTAYAHQLSGGMRQRVMIALALAGEPKLLLADEPTTALDVVVQRELLNEMRDLVRARGMSMLLVTHDLHLAHDVADDVSVMYAGHILEEGPVAQVIARPAHPYTEGLLNAMPDMESERGTLKPIPGEIPPPDRLGSGCPFASRCPRAREACRLALGAMKTLSVALDATDAEGEAAERRTRCADALLDETEVREIRETADMLEAIEACAPAAASDASSRTFRATPVDVRSEHSVNDDANDTIDDERRLVENAESHGPVGRFGSADPLSPLGEPQQTDFPVIVDVRVKRHCYYARKGFFGRRTPWDVLQDIDLKIRYGEVMGLVGESGCGKSTLARLMLGLSKPTEGTVLFKNEAYPEPRSQRWREQRSSMQMIYQDPYGCFDARIPIVDQVAEPLIVHSGLTPEEARSRALDVLKLVGMPEHHAGKLPGVMSGGQLQRAAIARAVALRPALLACDEPVASLDVSIQAQVLELLNRLREQTKMSMLFVSHNLNVVRYICDRVTVMYLGRIVETGDVDAVFGNPKHPYTRLLMASTPGANDSVVKYYPKGSMPSPIDRPAGCVFANRCPLARDVCRRSVPPLRTDASGHGVACFHGTSFLTATTSEEL